MSSPGTAVFSQGFTVAGHKIPYAAAGVVVAIIGVLVVLRARSQSAPVVALGTPTAVDAGSAPYAPYASLADLSTGLADLRNAITNGQLVPAASAPPGAPPNPPPPAPPIPVDIPPSHFPGGGWPGKPPIPVDIPPSHFPVPPTTANPAAVAAPAPYTSEGSWLTTALTSGQRGDVLAGLQQGRWGDLSGQYAQELGTLAPGATPVTAVSDPYASEGNWLLTAINGGQRPDIVAGIRQGRWSDLAGQYQKELATVGRHPGL